MISNRIRRSGLLVAIVLAAPTAALAQLGTPTQSPNAMISLERVSKDLRPAPNPQHVAEEAMQQAIVLEQMGSASCPDAKGLWNQLRRASVSISVADKVGEWRAAVVRTQSLVGELKGLATSTSCGKADLFEIAETAVVAKRLDDFDTDLKRALGAEFKPVLPRSDNATSFLNAASVSATEEAKQLALSPVDYFFSNHWRLYVRSTLVLDDTKDGVEAAGGAATAEKPPTLEDLAESVKLGLLDPYGGPLNVTAGYFLKIPTRFLRGHANDGGHGLFFDARAGLKFLPLPEQAIELTDGKTKNTPFYQASMALRAILPVFKGEPGSGDPGGVEAALSASVNRVADAGASTLFAANGGVAALLKKTTANLHLAVAINLPGSVSIDLAGTLLSNTKFDKRYLIGLRLSKDVAAKPAATATKED